MCTTGGSHRRRRVNQHNFFLLFFSIFLVSLFFLTLFSFLLRRSPELSKDKVKRKKIIQTIFFSFALSLSSTRPKFRGIQIYSISSSKLLKSGHKQNFYLSKTLKIGQVFPILIISFCFFEMNHTYVMNER